MTALPGLEDDTPRRWRKTEAGYLAHLARLPYNLDGYQFWGLAAADPQLSRHRGQLAPDEVDTVWLANPAAPLDYRLALVIIADGTVLAWRDGRAPDDPEHTTIGQGAGGRWWAQCTRPGCTHTTSGVRTREEVARFAANHQLHHRRRGLYR